MAGEAYTITGHVYDAATGATVGGLRVEAWDLDHIIDDGIASASVGADGAFMFSLTSDSLAAQFGDRTPALYFKLYSGESLLASTEATATWSKPQGAAPYEIPIAWSDPTIETPTPRCTDSQATRYTIAGVVASPDRADLRDLRVDIVDRNVGGDVLLSSATTDRCGNFSVTFPATLVTDRGKQRPDVQAKVYSNDALIASSDVRYNASGAELLTVVLPANSLDLPSEHDAVAAAIAAHYDGQLRDLVEDDTRRDITYLANKSGWDARAVAFAALADQFSAASAAVAGDLEIAAPFFYALFRAGFSTDPDRLYHAEPEAVEQAWQAAIQDGVIPASLGADIPAAVTRFRSLSSARFLSGPAVVGVSTMPALLQVSGLNSGQQQQFADIYVANRADPEALWTAVDETFDHATANKLRVDGKLAYLTVNNAPLMSAMHAAVGGRVTDPVQLARAGYYDWQQMRALVDGDVDVPPDFVEEGEDEEASRDRYAQHLAAQVAKSYPTAAMAHVVASGAVTVEQDSDVYTFLDTHSDAFVFGEQSIDQYIADADLADTDPGVVEQIKRLHRVYQLAPDIQTMSVMMENGLDTSAHIARLDRDVFVELYGPDLGGDEAAAGIHERATTMHNVALNVIVSYLTAKNAFPLGAQPLDPDLGEDDAARQILQPAPMGPGSVDLSGSRGMRGMRPGAGGPTIPAYPTLESLFGSMDFCTCESCRSMLSPAAYLVDLLKFLDATGGTSPLAEFNARRPDVQHLPLTCENTNTALPYIDLVNETLEYYITNSLSLASYLGHDTGAMTSEDLLASPAFVNDLAYATLAAERFPLPLPFHRPLESLRRHIEKFGSTLPAVMETLRHDDSLERGSNEYGWRDILIEELHISRAEYQILTDSTAVPLWSMYGFPSGTSDASAIATLSNAKAFCRRLELSYEELVEILKTRFVNPNSDLIPKLERLGVGFTTLKSLKDGTITNSQFTALLPTGTLAPDAAEYGGNIINWVKDATNYSRIMSLILLSDVMQQSSPCSFDVLELRLSRPMTGAGDTSTRLAAADYIRLLRFIRMWRKLGWTIEQTDAALCALYRSDMAQISGADLDSASELDAGFAILLPRLGVVARIVRELDLKPERDLDSLLVSWADIPTHGPNALYRRMFLTPTILAGDPVYADDGYGGFLTDGSARIVDHIESLRAAFNLTGEEFDLIFAALGYDSSTALSIPNISAIYRRGYLARALRVSVRELLLVMSRTAIDPFAIPSLTAPATLALAGLLDELKDASLKLTAALYLVWNQDLSGRSAPTATQVNEFARGLREDFAKIEKEFTVVDDPEGDIARARMALVYGVDATDYFFNLLNNTYITSFPYTHFAPAFGPVLAAAVASAGGTYGTSNTPRLAYDDFQQTITFNGYLDATKRGALKAVVTNPAVVAEVPPGELMLFQSNFRSAIDVIYQLHVESIALFFARYEELLSPYNSYIASAAPLDVRRSELLVNFLPSLIARRKTQQALQRLADAAKVDRAFAETLVNASPASSGIHAVGNTSRPALDDLLAVENEGLTVRFFDGGTIGVNPHDPETAPNLSYAMGTSQTLPENYTDPGNPISASLDGYIQAPEAGDYWFTITAESGSSVALTIDGSPIPLTHTGSRWRSSAAYPLKAGTLYAFQVMARNMYYTLRVQWETAGHGLVVIPPEALYPATQMGNARDAYLRFLKAGAMAGALKLTAAETARPEHSAGVSWLNALPISADIATPWTLLPPLRELLDFAWLKRRLSPDGDGLLKAVRALAATAPDTARLYALTGWDPTATAALATRFGTTVPGLKAPALLRRVYRAMALAESMGISTAALAAGTTNEPTATIVRDLQSALRARYSAEDWRTVVQPINDQMRSLQRDALVAYILHKLGTNPSTANINTPERLFEYFLMDVQMEPCMQTSRIRHALSSVQLFIERCLMNLEPTIDAALLSSKKWEWMKRYRVWEANRKVFLFPENWLDPELRDDKSQFFKELESELLQSDITEETASVAMLNYLSKLEEVAKLEPCGIYNIPGDPAHGVGEVEHVVARTPGTSRKYYYRRREYGYWTPWERIDLDIEGDPVVPVVWKGRLLLFWLRILKSGPESTANQIPTGGQTLSSVVMPPDPRMRVEVILCWSEYYNGKWQPAKTSNVEAPELYGDISAGGPYPFDRTRIPIFVEEIDDALRVMIAYSSALRFYNTHGEPLHDYAWAPVSYVYPPAKERWIMSGTNDLSIQYIGVGNKPNVTRQVIKPPIDYRIVQTLHPVPDIWAPPFFFRDARHVFYVSSTHVEVPLQLIPNWGSPTTTGGTGTTTGTTTAGSPTSGFTTKPSTNGFSNGLPVVNGTQNGGLTAAAQFLSEDANIQQAFASPALVSFNGTAIGPGGAVNDSAH